jgi:hypothetical protein
MGKKLGDGHMKAMGRQGLAELRAAFYTGSNIAQPTEAGIFGRPTPGEIANEREESRFGADGREAEGRPSVLKDALERAQGWGSNRGDREVGRENPEVGQGDRE